MMALEIQSFVVHSDFFEEHRLEAYATIGSQAGSLCHGVSGH